MTKNIANDKKNKNNSTNVKNRQLTTDLHPYCYIVGTKIKCSHK